MQRAHYGKPILNYQCLFRFFFGELIYQEQHSDDLDWLPRVLTPAPAPTAIFDRKPKAPRRCLPSSIEKQDTRWFNPHAPRIAQQHYVTTELEAARAASNSIRAKPQAEVLVSFQSHQQKRQP